MDAFQIKIIQIWTATGHKAIFTRAAHRNSNIVAITFPMFILMPWKLRAVGLQHAEVPLPNQNLLRCLSLSCMNVVESILEMKCGCSSETILRSELTIYLYPPYPLQLQALVSIFILLHTFFAGRELLFGSSRLEDAGACKYGNYFILEMQKFPENQSPTPAPLPFRLWSVSTTPCPAV